MYNRYIHICSTPVPDIIYYIEACTLYECYHAHSDIIRFQWVCLYFWFLSVCAHALWWEGGDRNLETGPL